MNVKVFGMQNCAGCVNIKRLLNEKGIHYTEYDVMNPEHMAEAQKYNVRGVPTVVRDFQQSFGSVTGSTVSNIEKIKDMLGFE